jgi:hypothetical protein
MIKLSSPLPLLVVLLAGAAQAQMEGASGARPSEPSGSPSTSPQGQPTGRDGQVMEGPQGQMGGASQAGVMRPCTCGEGMAGHMAGGVLLGTLAALFLLAATAALVALTVFLVRKSRALAQG